jgi:uncharacterized protein
MKEQFTRSAVLPGGPDAAWSLLREPGAVLSWFSIVGDVREVDPPVRYAATLADRLGPFRLTAQLDVTIEWDDAGRSLRGIGRGEDRQISSRIAVDVTVGVRDVPDGCVVEISGAYEITGRPAALGASSIKKKVRRILDEFVQTAQSRLGGGNG